jgi:hypothetical protein
MDILNYIYLISFILTAILIVIYDFKIQKIPIILLLTNYISMSLMVNYWLLLGVLVIFCAKIFDFPIDILYVGILCYLIIILHNNLSIFAILIVLIQILLSTRKESFTKENLSLMVSLEPALLFELLILIWR